jgi:Holliday junction resolvase RusA-like endonuclease
VSVLEDLVGRHTDSLLLDPQPLRTFRLTIPGEPVAKGRPRLGTVAGHAMAFTPAKTRRYEDIVRQTAVREWNRPLLADTPLTLSVAFFRQIPKSASKKVKEGMLLGSIRPIGRPDLDNNVKAVIDALNGVVFYDDSAIVETHSSKWYGLEPRVEVTLTW